MKDISVFTIRNEDNLLEYQQKGTGIELNDIEVLSQRVIKCLLQTKRSDIFSTRFGSFVERFVSEVTLDMDETRLSGMIGPILKDVEELIKSIDNEDGNDIYNSLQDIELIRIFIDRRDRINLIIRIHNEAGQSRILNVSKFLYGSGSGDFEW